MLENTRRNYRDDQRLPSQQKRDRDYMGKAHLSPAFSSGWTPALGLPEFCDVGPLSPLDNARCQHTRQRARGPG